MQQVQAQVNFRQDILFCMRLINWRLNVVEFSVANDYTWCRTIIQAVCSRTCVFNQGKRFIMCVIDVHMCVLCDPVSHVHMWNHLITGLHMWSSDCVIKIIIHMWFDINCTWSPVETQKFKSHTCVFWTLACKFSDSHVYHALWGAVL